MLLFVVLLGAALVLLQAVVLVAGEPEGPVAHNGVGVYKKHQLHDVQQVPVVL
jgi:hypothetical protein